MTNSQNALEEMTARKDAAYLERNQVVAALAKCFPSGIAKTAIEGWSEDWHQCVYIDLPTGQVSWHFHDSQAYLFDGLPPYQGAWDGHDTPEKYRRLSALQRQPDLWVPVKGSLAPADTDLLLTISTGKVVVGMWHSNFGWDWVDTGEAADEEAHVTHWRLFPMAAVNA